MRAIERAASQWLARQSLGTLSQEDRGAFERWLLEDAAHGAIFDRMSGALASLDGAGTVVREVDRRARAASVARSARTASVGIGLACAAAVAFFSIVDVAAELADVHNGRGEQREIALQDGSRLLVDADAAVDIHYDRDARLLRLIRGRIHVTVRHGDDRPFRVAAAGEEVRDIGTAFDVALRRDGAETIVTEGVVRVGNDDTALRLTKGQGARWQWNSAPQTMRLPAGGETASWRYGRLVFDRQPFGEVVATLDPYSSRPVWLWNRKAAGRLVSGVVRTAAVDASLPSLARAQGLRVRDLGIAILLY